LGASATEGEPIIGWPGTLVSNLDIYSGSTVNREVIGSTRFDPEASLTLSRTVLTSSGGIVSNTDFPTDDGYITIAMDVYFPENPSDGVLFEKGGDTNGIWLGLRDNGQTLRLRAGNGDSAENTLPSDAAILDTFDFPRDSKVHTVVAEIGSYLVPGVRLWIDGENKGFASPPDGAYKLDKHSSLNDGGYLQTTSNVPTDEPSANWPANGFSGLRVYDGQILSLTSDPDSNKLQFEIFSGFLDQMNISDNPDNSVIELTIENKLIRLDRPRSVRYTSQYQKTKYPSDQGLDYINAIQDQVVNWGPE